MQIVIKGAGDLASGIAHRLVRCGFPVIMTEVARPTTVRCTVAFSPAVYNGSAVVEGITARLASSAADAQTLCAQGEIAVLVDPDAACIEALHPQVVIDAVLAKRNLGTKMTDAPVVVAVGPGFTAGVDCHAVVETQRGHDLGRVFLSGGAAPNTGVPGPIGGYTTERIIRASRDGVFSPIAKIGQAVTAGEIVATVEGEPVRAQIGGTVRGMLPAGTPVTAGMKSGDVDPRNVADYCDTISDKARAIAGGVLEAVLYLNNRRESI